MLQSSRSISRTRSRNSPSTRQESSLLGSRTHLRHQGLQIPGPLTLSIPRAPSLAKIHLAFGLRNQDAVRAAILPVLFLLSPILICLWMSRAALRDAKTDPTGAWFSYFRVLTWCGNCLVLIWMMRQTVREGVELIASYYTSAHTAAAVALGVGILMLPPWLAFFICILLSYGVYRQVRGEAWTRRDFLVNQFLGIASQFLPLACFLAAIGMISISGQASVALFACVYVGYVVCKWLRVKYSGLHIEPLTRGELRDKVFEIAKKAAVEVRQVFISPCRKVADGECVCLPRSHGDVHRLSFESIEQA